MSLGYNDQTHTFEVLKVDDLPCPVLLGCDASRFGVLVLATLPGMTVAAMDKPKEDDDGPLEQDPKELQAKLAIGPQFPQDQKKDPSLDRLRQDVVVSDGAVLNSRQATRVPRIEIVKGLLWWVTMPQQTGRGRERQLVVPPAPHQGVAADPWTPLGWPPREGPNLDSSLRRVLLALGL